MKYTRVMEFGGNEWVVDAYNNPVRRVATYCGNSGRVKPTYEDGARDADRLFDTDTGKVYVFDEDTKSWNEV